MGRVGVEVIAASPLPAPLPGYREAGRGGLPHFLPQLADFFFVFS